MVIVSTKNMAKEFYPKHYKMMPINELIRVHIKKSVDNNIFEKFFREVYTEFNAIITKYNILSKYLGYLLEKYYEKNKRLDNFLIIDEAHLLLNHISLIEITKKFNLLLSVFDSGISHITC